MATKKKKAPEKRKVQNIKSLSNRTMILVGIIVLLLAIFIVNRTQIFLEGRKFREYSKTVKNVGLKIASNTAPQEQRQAEYCSRSNIKYEQGPLGCETHYYILYSATDSILTNSIMKESEFTAKEVNKRIDINVMAHGDINKHPEQCWYTLYRPGKVWTYALPVKVFNVGKTGQLLDIVCSAPAKTSHYKYVEY